MSALLLVLLGHLRALCLGLTLAAALAGAAWIYGTLESRGRQIASLDQRLAAAERDALLSKAALDARAAAEARTARAETALADTETRRATRLARITTEIDHAPAGTACAHSPAVRAALGVLASADGSVLRSDLPSASAPAPDADLQR